MDTLDRLSIWAIVALIISSFVLAAGYRGEAGPDRKKQQRMQSGDYAAVNGETAAREKIIKNLIEANNLDKAEVMVRELMQKYPYEAAPHMLMGDIHVRRQELVEAMPEYREGIDLNPDYLDKKTPLFQGKKLKVVVNEALDVVEGKIEAEPANETMKDNRKLIYYLKRRIAGSCG